MADVNIQSTPASSGGSSGAVWALVVVVLLVVIGWFVFGGRINQTKTTKVEINVPGAPAGGGGAKKP
jgi:hypothetical protein